MTTLWALEAAARFWEAAGGPPSVFPRDLRQAVAYATPLFVVDLPRLRISEVASWLEARQCGTPPRVQDRPLHAALYAGPDGGFVFLDGADPEDERRFSLAHEVAHFIVAYVEPRRRAAARLGPEALEVVDGRRRPTPTERIDAALAGLDLRPRLHLLERTDLGLSPAPVEQVEQQADELALELLAPAELVARLRPVQVSPSALATWLAATFGLPARVGEAYARHFARGGPRPFAGLVPARLRPDPVQHRAAGRRTSGARRGTTNDGPTQGHTPN